MLLPVESVMRGAAVGGSDILKVSVVLGLQKRITGSGDISCIMFVNITQHFSTAARQKAARMLGSFRVMVMLMSEAFKCWSQQ